DALNEISSPYRPFCVSCVSCGNAGSNPAIDADRAGHGAPVRGPARRSRGSQGGADCSLRAHDQGPDFLAEPEKLNFEVNPVSADKLDALLAGAYATPKDVIAKAAKAMSD